MSGTLKIGGKTLATHDTSSNKLAFHSDANDTGQLCRAWVNFNGTGTVAIRAGFNVSSITDWGLGNYEVHYTTAMPDANYSVQATIQSTLLANAYFSSTCSVTNAASNVTPNSVRVQVVGGSTVNNSSSIDDTPYVFVAVFR